MIRHSPPWPHVNNHHHVVNGKEDDKESVSGEWNDKIMNRNDSLTSDDSLVGQWEAESKQFSPLLSPSSLSEHSKLCLEPEFEMTTDESDELEIATSGSSESDMNWLIQAPKPTALSNGLGSNAKKSIINPRPTKIPEIR